MGLATAVTLGWILYRGAHAINLGVSFKSTGIFLIFFAAGLLVLGMNEVQEAGYLPILVEHVWYMNSVLDENGTLGSFLKSIFGSNGNPSLLEIAAYPLPWCCSLLFPKASYLEKSLSFSSFTRRVQSAIFPSMLRLKFLDSLGKIYGAFRRIEENTKGIAHV